MAINPPSHDKEAALLEAKVAELQQQLAAKQKQLAQAQDMLYAEPPEREFDEQYEAWFDSLDHEEQAREVIQRSRSSIPMLEARIAEASARLAEQRLGLQIRAVAAESSIQREAAISRLRGKTAWAAASLLGAILGLAVAGELHHASPAAVSRVLWFSGAAVAVAALHNVLLAVVHGTIEVISGVSRFRPKLARFAEPARHLVRATAYLPTIIVLAELALTGAGALNLKVVLETIAEGQG